MAIQLQRKLSQRKALQKQHGDLATVAAALLECRKRVERQGVLIDTLASILISKKVCTEAEFKAVFKDILEPGKAAIPKPSVWRRLKSRLFHRPKCQTEQLKADTA